MENYKKQTAVEWLIESMLLSHEQRMQFEGLFQQAKAMEKEQIIQTYWEAYKEGQYSGDRTAEEYYNKTYNKQDNDN